ncbi:MAG: glycosyltransferase family 39 protein, partial [Chloroflexota bacterium]
MRGGQLSRARLGGVALGVAVLAFYALAVARGLGFFVWHDDEPVLTLTAKAVFEGHALYREVWFNYAPGLIVYLRAAYGLAGYSLGTARLAVALAGVAGLCVVGLLGGALGRRGAGLLAMALLASAPHWVVLSSAVLAEVPSFTLMALAVLCALRHVRTRGLPWLLASGVAAGAAVACKPTAAPVALVPLTAVLLVERGARRRVLALAALALAGAAPLVATLLPHHPADFARQFVVTWRNSRGMFPPEPLANLRQIGLYWLRDKYGLWHLGLLAAAGVGWLGLRRRRAAEAALMAAWAGGMALALVLHSPLYRHHLAALLPPVCVLAGVGLANLAAQLRTAPRGRQWAIAILLAAVALEARDGAWAG